MTTMFGKTTLVTGSGEGIGRMTAIKFAKAGARVVVCDIHPEDGAETVAHITANGGEALFVRADVANPRDVASLIDQTVAAYGKLDCACNNAGIEGQMFPLIDQSLEAFDQVIGVNLRGVFLCLQAEIRQMLTTGGGAIVNLASVAGLIGFPGLTPYVASKHGVNGLTKNAALEYGKSGIRVNSVCPGGIDTRMLDSVAEQATGGAQTAHEMMDPLHPIGRIGTTEEVADLIVWLCSSEASFITGANIPVDGGYVAQ